MGDDEKKFCFICDVRIKEDLLNKTIYPPFEFKEGNACFGCGKRKQEANMKAKGISKKTSD